MILNEHNGEPSSAPPASADGLCQHDPVWWTPCVRSSQPAGAPIAARLVRVCDSMAWITILRPEGGLKRVPAGLSRLAPRVEFLRVDLVWADSLGMDGEAFTNGALEAQSGALNGDPARAQPLCTSPPMTAEASPATAGATVGTLLQCPHCGATGGRRGKKFRNVHDLRQHQTIAHPEHYPSIPPRAPLLKKYQPRTAPAYPPSDAANGATLRCPDCGATAGRRGQKFHRTRDLLRHRAVAHGHHAQHSRTAAQPPHTRVVRFCGGCGVNLEAIPMPVRFCPACGLDTATINDALGTHPR
ncbi:MAG: hypothetical protein K8R23_08750 [Chthoniobacter sp.]|nr:hypothetical protein [Chthoniobacter sp.]